MEQNIVPIDISSTVLHFLVCGCEVHATFAPESNQNVYQRVKQILVDTCTHKATSNCEKYGG